MSTGRKISVGLMAITEVKGRTKLKPVRKKTSRPAQYAAKKRIKFKRGK